VRGGGGEGEGEGEEGEGRRTEKEEEDLGFRDMLCRLIYTPRRHVNRA